MNPPPHPDPCGSVNIPAPGDPASAAHEIDRLKRLYVSLGRVHQAIIHVHSREELFLEVCRLTAEHSGFRLVWIGWLDLETRLVHPVGRYGRNAELLDQICVRADDSPEGRGAIGTCIREDRPCIVNEILSDPRGGPWRDLASAYGIRSVAAIPIRLGDEVCGAIAVYSQESNVFREEETALLDGIAADISYALDNLERISRHREAEAALRRSDRNLRRAQAIAQLNTWFGDLRTGTFQITQEDSAFAGMGADAHTLEDLMESVHPDDRERVQTAWQAALAGTPYDVEHRILVRGQTRWLHVRAETEFDREGRPTAVTAISQDITERKRAERRLAIQHAVSHVLADSQTLQDATPRILRTLGEAEGWDFAAIWEVDQRSHVLRASDVWHVPDLPLAALAAETRESALSPGVGLPGRVWTGGRPVFIPNVLRDSDLPRAATAARAGLAAAFGFPVRVREGISGVIDFFGRSRSEPDSALLETLDAVGRQIGQFIERKRAQEQLQRFVSVSPAVLYALKIENSGLRFLWISENVGDVTGYPAEHRFNRAWWIAGIHPEDRARVLATQPLPYNLEHTVVEFRFRRADGNYRWLRDERRLLHDAAGRPSEVIGTWVDITRRVELEAQLRQSQKMESLGQLSGGIAHDFNNLLAIILGNIQILRMDMPPDHPAQTSIDEIYEAGGRARNLVQQILAFSRRQAPERRVIDLRPVIDQGVRMLRSVLPVSIEIVTHVDPGPLRTSADSNQLHQVLLNLGTNAWHACEGRPGRLEIRLSRVDLDEAAVSHLARLQPGSHLLLSVQDNGKGMDSATLERIFDPFFTTKEPGLGTGLGLSVVHGIIQAHEGAIEVSSQPGGGATFRIYLPASPAEPAPAPPRRPARPGQGKRILFLDDETSVLTSTSRMLERIDYHVAGFTNPDEALRALRQNPDAVDVVITDFNMPGISGLDVAAAMLEARPGLPILLNSGYVSPELLADARRIGIRQVLQKPCSVADISEAIHSALESPSPAP